MVNGAMMTYYLLKDDMWLEESSDRWIFDRFKYASDRGNIEFIDPPIEYMEPCTYSIDLYRKGRETDFSFTMDSGNIPIVSKKVTSSLKGLNEIDEPYRLMRIHNNLLVRGVVVIAGPWCVSTLAQCLYKGDS